MTAPETDETAHVDRRLDRLPDRVRRLFEAEAVRYDRLFTLILTVYIGSLLVMTLDYRAEAQLVPFVIGIPTFVLLLTVLAIQSSDRVAAIAEKFSSAEVFGVDDDSPPVDDLPSEVESSTDLDASQARRVLGRFGLLSSTVILLVLFLLVYIVGFYVGIVVFLLGVYRWRAGLSWPRTFVITAVVWLFVVGIFHVLLNARLYTGVLDFGLAGVI